MTSIILTNVGIYCISEIYNYLYSNNNNNKINEEEKNKKLTQIKMDLENTIISKVKSQDSLFFTSQISKNFNTNDFNLFLKQLYESESILRSIHNTCKNNIESIKILDNLSTFNIFCLGPTGVGKSTLINSVLNLPENEQAKTDIGRPVTLGEPKKYTSKVIKGLNIYDSQGIDKGEYNINDLINSVKKLVENLALTNDINNFIHCIWYCVTEDRFEETEKNCIIKLLELYNDNSLPIILVYTKAVFEEESEENLNEIIRIIKEDIKNKEININFCKVLSKDKEINSENNKIVIKKFGINNLIKLSFNKINNAVKSSIFYSVKKLIKNNFIKEINEIKIQCKNDLNLFIKNIAFNQKIKMLKNYLKQIIDKISKKIIFKFNNNNKFDNKSNNNIIDYLNNYQKFIENNFINFYENFLKDSCLDIIKNISNNNNNNIEKNNFNLNLLNNNKNNNKIYGKIEEDFEEKIKNNIQDFVFKKSIEFIGNKFIDNIGEMIINTYLVEINDIDFYIDEKVKKSMINIEKNIIEIVNNIHKEEE